MQEIHQTSYAKGEELESAFEKWMQSELDYVNIKRKSTIKGWVGGEYKPDILGQRTSLRAILIIIVSIIYLALLVPMVIFPDYTISLWRFHKYIGSKLSVQPPEGEAIVALLFLGIFAIVWLLVGLGKRQVHCWVECKNWKTPVGREVVQKLFASIAVAKKHDSARWEAILVSDKGYSKEALRLAFELDIRCYERKQERFEEMWPKREKTNPYGPNVKLAKLADTTDEVEDRAMPGLSPPL